MEFDSRSTPTPDQPRSTPPSDRYDNITWAGKLVIPLPLHPPRSLACAFSPLWHRSTTFKLRHHQRSTHLPSSPHFFDSNLPLTATQDPFQPKSGPRTAGRFNRSRPHYEGVSRRRRRPRHKRMAPRANATQRERTSEHFFESRKMDLIS